VQAIHRGCHAERRMVWHVTCCGASGVEVQRPAGRHPQVVRVDDRVVVVDRADAARHRRAWRELHRRDRRAHLHSHPGLLRKAKGTPTWVDQRSQPIRAILC
jgi:hypothetical protein